MESRIPAQRSREYQLNDSAKYCFDSIDTITSLAHISSSQQIACRAQPDEGEKLRSHGSSIGMIVCKNPNY